MYGQAPQTPTGFFLHKEVDNVIYQEPFNGSGGIHGTAETKSGELFRAASEWTKGGGLAIVAPNPSNNSSMTLPLSIAVGERYRVSADINVITVSAFWMSLGFSSLYESYAHPPSHGHAWMILRGTRGASDDIQTFIRGTGDGVNYGPVSTGWQNLGVELERTGTNTWAITWRLNGAVIRTATKTQTVTITAVNVHAYNLSGEADNLLLERVL